MLISLLILVVFALLAYWVITTFFPEPIRMVALLVVGVICLIVLFEIVAPLMGVSVPKSLI
jgi:hypothetical protein